MRSKLWLPIVASSSEPARARIPAGAFDFPRARQRLARNAGTRTSRRLGHGSPGGSRCSRASRSWPRWLWFSGPGRMQFAAIWPVVAGNQSPNHIVETSSGTAQSDQHTAGPTPAGQPLGGIARLRCLRVKAFATSCRSSCRTESRLFRSIRFTAWKVGTSGEFTGLRSAYLGPFTRFP